jgi:uncharacterized protein
LNPEDVRLASVSELSPGPLAKLLILLVKGYRGWRDWCRRPPRCGFIPSCSEYAVRALNQYGALKGTMLTVRRLSRCNPRYSGPRVDFP